MALVLQQQLAPNSTALVGGCCSRGFKTLLAGGERGLIGERVAASVWSMKRLHIQVGRTGTQHRMGSSEITALLQQTSTSSSSPTQKPSHLQSCEGHVSSAKVFEDEAQGIACYLSTSGEVTCEGHDEGPHFEPAEGCHERKAEAKSLCKESASMEEVLSYKYVTAGQGKHWCEGKDEC